MKNKLSSMSEILSHLIIRYGGHPENDAKQYFGVKTIKQIHLIDSAIASYLTFKLGEV